MINTVLIDIDNTLLDFHACAERAIEKAMSDHGLNADEHLYQVFYRVTAELWRQIEARTLDHRGLCRQRWNTIFGELDIGLDGESFEAQFRENLKHEAIPMPGARELLRYFANKYPVYAASNGPHQQQLMRLEKAGLTPYIEDLFTSERLGHPKPGKDFFDACFFLLPNSSPASTIIIGDSLNADINGGAAYGLTTCWFNHEALPVPQGCPADYVVRTLAEIQEFL